MENMGILLKLAGCMALLFAVLGIYIWLRDWYKNQMKNRFKNDDHDMFYH